MKGEKCHKLLQCECWEPSLTPRTEPARPDGAVFASTDWVGKLEAAHQDLIDMRIEAGKTLSQDEWAKLWNASEAVKLAVEVARGRLPTVVFSDSREKPL